MRKPILFIFYFILLSKLYAQHGITAKFDRLEAVGEMPEYFNNIVRSDYKFGETKNQDIEAIQEQTIKGLLVNGKILFGDTVTLYLNNLLDKILAKHSDLRKQVRIYALKSEQVNAFITSSGIIFVNLGLIAQCSNEAELAFILSHELIHFVKSHARINPRNISDINSFLKYHARSRELEMDADQYGFLEFYKNLGYRYNAVEGALDVLQFSDLPFEERKIPRSFFESDYYWFPDEYFLREVTPVSSRANYIDTLSTHPNIRSRRQELRKLINQYPDTIAGVFDLLGNQFEGIQTLARFESINQMIINQNPLDAYYNSLALAFRFPENPFLHQAEAAALYTLYKIRATGRYPAMIKGAKYLQGEIQYTTFLLENLTKKEMMLWTLRTIWAALKVSPENRYLTLIFYDVVKDIVLNIGGLDQFSDFGKEDLAYIRRKPMSGKTKYELFKEKRPVAPQDYFKTENYMLADLKQDSLFLSTFEEGVIAAERLYINKVIFNLKEKSALKTKLCIFHPSIEIKTGKKNKNPLKSFEKNSLRIIQSCGFEPDLISSADFDPRYSYQFHARLGEFKKNMVSYIPLFYESRQAGFLAEELKTPYFNTLKYTESSRSNTGNIIYNATFSFFAVFMYPALPFAALSWASQNRGGNLENIIYDLNDRNYVYVSTVSFKTENKSYLYQTLYRDYSAAREAIK